MFLRLFEAMRAAKLPVSLKEYLALMEAMDKHVISDDVNEFYYLSRAVLVKDERNLDRFDRVFGEVFKGLESAGDLKTDIPEDWLKSPVRTFPDRRGKETDRGAGRLGQADGNVAPTPGRTERPSRRRQQMDRFARHLAPSAIPATIPKASRIGQREGRHGRAVKVWDRREYRNLDDTVELGTRNIKVALRRLRQWARHGAATELDLPGTITDTANKGYLDLRLVPERHNAVKVLLLLDVGGSMDPHIRTCEELFSAARGEFKHLDFYYFHNCVYEGVWKDNRRRRDEQVPTMDLLRKYPRDWKIILVGDAMMSPYEISMPGGAVEHMNPEAGAVWLRRLADQFPHLAWLNPAPENQWPYTPSVDLIGQLVDGRMFPLTLAGLDAAMRELNR